MRTLNQSIVKDLENKAQQIRKLILEISHKAQVGHIGSALSIADILAVLYFKILRINPKKPKWNLRDRFILSKGHAVAALYSTLFLKGFFTKKILLSYCQNKGFLGEHPEHRVLGVELTTGSLGHGLSVGLGMALSAKIDKKHYQTFILISDAECNEGEVWQAALTASHHRLDNLIVIIDYNKVQALGTTREVLNLEPFYAKWEAFGWNVFEVDGHNIAQMLETFTKVQTLKLKVQNKKPTVIIAHTIRGKGISFMENKLEWHYFTTNDKQYRKAVKELES
ncbi:MAG: transketolase [Candidatus Omnitrophica bacterium]|nr:transketolase [Candidatus Omnitrophota bacterium]